MHPNQEGKLFLTKEPQQKANSNAQETQSKHKRNHI